eukprot:COSAG01_NODE_4038_length_5412_cov_5.119706_2_plen_488_part_00
MGFLLQMLVACTCVIAPILGLTIWILLKSSPRCKGTNDPSNDAETHVSPRAANARLIIISLLITTIAKTTYSYVLICEPAPEGVLCSRAHPTFFLSLSLSLSLSTSLYLVTRLGVSDVSAVAVEAESCCENEMALISMSHGDSVEKSDIDVCATYVIPHCQGDDYGNECGAECQASLLLPDSVPHTRSTSTVNNQWWTLFVPCNQLGGYDPGKGTDQNGVYQQCVPLGIQLLLAGTFTVVTSALLVLLYVMLRRDHASGTVHTGHPWVARYRTGLFSFEILFYAHKLTMALVATLFSEYPYLQIVVIIATVLARVGLHVTYLPLVDATREDNQTEVTDEEKAERRKALDQPLWSQPNKVEMFVLVSEFLVMVLMLISNLTKGSRSAGDGFDLLLSFLLMIATLPPFVYAFVTMRWPDDASHAGWSRERTLLCPCLSNSQAQSDPSNQLPAPDMPSDSSDPLPMAGSESRGVDESKTFDNPIGEEIGN